MIDNSYIFIKPATEGLELSRNKFMNFENKRKLPLTIRWIGLKPHERAVVWQILQTTGGWVARYLNKPLSVPMSIFLARRGVTPNHITLLNLILGLLAGLLASLGGYHYLFLGALLFQGVSIIDGCDGEVAKLNNQESKFGAWFDTIGDNMSFVAFITGVTIGLYHETHAKWVLYAAEISLVSFAVLLSIMVSYLLQKKVHKASLITYEKEVLEKSISDKKNPLTFFMKYGKYLIKKDFFAFLFFVLAVFNLPGAIVFFAALGSFAVSLTLSILTLKNRRAQQLVLSKGTSEVIQ